MRLPFIAVLWSILPKLSSDLLKMSTESCHLFPKTLHGFPIILKILSHILQELTSVFVCKLLALHHPANVLPVLLTPGLLSFPQPPRGLTSGPLSIFLLVHSMPSFFSFLKTCCAWLRLTEAFLEFSTEIRFPALKLFKVFVALTKTYTLYSTHHSC